MHLLHSPTRPDVNIHALFDASIKGYARRKPVFLQVCYLHTIMNYIYYNHLQSQVLLTPFTFTTQKALNGQLTLRSV